MNNCNLDKIILELEKIHQCVDTLKKEIEGMHIPSFNKSNELKEVKHNPDDYLEIGGRCEVCISRNCIECPYVKRYRGGD